MTRHRNPICNRPELRFAVLLSIWTAILRPASGQEPAPVDFARDIRPILENRCLVCHHGATREHGFDLSSRDTALVGGDSGKKGIVPNQPGESRLFQLISSTDEEHRMPPKTAGDALSADEIAKISAWISAGAVWPVEANFKDDAPPHWSFVKPVRPAMPPVINGHWPRNGIDFFVLARLEKEGLLPQSEAEKAVLLRRVSLDLTGLPPSLEETRQFLLDNSPDAYERAVDRLLASPAYGERWARMWLDMARYADSKGYGSDPLRTIWRYRDWVIEAFNRNLTYDQFTIEQLAGDLLQGATEDQLLATAFHRNTMANDEGGTDDEEFRVAAVKDRIDTTMQVWMGLTLGCAKCHSHKYDPISQREYYQFFAIFNQTEDADRPDEEPKIPTPTAGQRERLAQLNLELEAARTALENPPPELAAQLDAGQAKWEAHCLSRINGWERWGDFELSSPGGAVTAKLDDRSLVVRSDPAETDTYSLVTTLYQPRISAIRLEVIPDTSLPNGGAGLQGSTGNFVLTNITASLEEPNPAARVGRYLRIDLPGPSRILSLAEVQVFRGDENIALKGKTSQSSIDYDGPPQLAIDGNTDGDFNQAKSTTHTKQEENPWWEIDLGESLPVDRIVVWNRSDSEVHGRLANAQVKLLDQDRKLVWQRTISDPPKTSIAFGTADPQTASFSRATASQSNPDFPVEHAIDADGKTGWSASTQNETTQAAAFSLTEPLVAPGEARLTIKLHQDRGEKQLLGRFRISFMEHDDATILPGEVAQALVIPPVSRTVDRQKILRDFYRARAPELESARQKVAELEAALAQFKKEIPSTPILRELNASQQRVTNVMLKGNYLNPGDPVQPGVPSAFHRLPLGAATDRLSTAKWLVDVENPLTARVAVNRFWAQLFGMGIVETEEDFGRMGLPPTHPELLDYLAVEFMSPSEPGARPWDIKRLLKRIVMSATYRQSSHASDKLIAKDRLNRLYARGPRTRLDAEMIRDQALFLSGLLSKKLGGPSVYPPQPEGLWRAAFNGERTWATSTGEDRYRRGVYTYWRRTIPYPSMATFDAPSREICTIRRYSTNTPLQALVTLNDPAYTEAAQALARRILKQGGASDSERAHFSLALCLARDPNAQQVSSLEKLVVEQTAHFREHLAEATQLSTDPLGPLPADMDPAVAAAWTVAANVLLNLDGVLAKR